MFRDKNSQRIVADSSTSILRILILRGRLDDHVMLLLHCEGLLGTSLEQKCSKTLRNRPNNIIAGLGHFRSVLILRFCPAIIQSYVLHLTITFFLQII